MAKSKRSSPSKKRRKRRLAPSSPPPASGKRPVGHPPVYTPELAAEVCRRIALGESVESIGCSDGMPSADTIHGWAVDDTRGFFGDYMRARRIQSLSGLDEQLQIADNSGLDVTVNELGKVVVNGELVKRAELRIKTRQWAMERVYEKVFGNKLKIEDTTPPITDEELDRRIAEKAKTLRITLP